MKAVVIKNYESEGTEVPKIGHSFEQSIGLIVRENDDESRMFLISDDAVKTCYSNSIYNLIIDIKNNENLKAKVLFYVGLNLIFFPVLNVYLVENGKITKLWRL